MTDFGAEAIKQAGAGRGKIETAAKFPVASQNDLSIQYTPGVGEVSRAIARDSDLGWTHTIRGNTVAVVSDGSAILGLGNLGPVAALPVMEGKAVIFKKFAGIDAWPIVLGTQVVDEIVAAVRAIAPGFGAVNLEDISAPRCFEIEERLQDIGIPVFHDDQHGTAGVVLAALTNALKVVGKRLENCRVVMAGAGAAGQTVARALMGAKEVIVCDRKGAIYQGRDGLDPWKEKLAKETNRARQQGSLREVLAGADVFIGVSGPGIVDRAMIASMHKDAIVFALSNPVPEIMPEDAIAAGAAVVATGRSDLPNQVNNALAYPGIFRGALDVRATRITEKMQLAAAHALASLVTDPSPTNIIPSIFDPRVVPIVSKAVAEAWQVCANPKEDHPGRLNRLPRPLKSV